MEREEFCTLARQLRAGIMALSLRFLKDEAEAEDFVQTLKTGSVKDTDDDDFDLF